MGYLLPLISAIIYFTSFHPYTHGYLAFFSLTPFFLALSKSTTFKKAAISGVLWGITLSVLFSIPLFYALITEYDFSILYSSLLIVFSIYIPYGIIYGIYGVSFKYFFEKIGFYFPVFAASLWLIIDYLMSITPIFLPWGYAGYTQTFSIFLQICDISGIYGVTFLVVLINSFFIQIILNKKKNFKSSISILLLIIISIVLYGNLRIKSIKQIMQSTNKSSINAAIIQGNFSSKDKWDSKNTAAVINKYVKMTKEVIGKSDIIIWPETVLNSGDKNNLEIISGISSLLNPNQIFIAGATRNDKKNNTFNSILMADNKGLVYIYDKKILFPFTETTFAGFSSGKFIDSPSIFTKGKTKPVKKFNSSTYGFTICLEAIYPEYVRKIKNLGANILINVANDSWFGNTYEPYMNLYSNIARAIENRFYVIRASNTGISAIISPTGEIISSIDLNTCNKTITSINIKNIPTFFSKTGDWLIVFSLLIIILELMYQFKFKQ